MSSKLKDGILLLPRITASICLHHSRVQITVAKLLDSIIGTITQLFNLGCSVTLRIFERAYNRLLETLDKSWDCLQHLMF